MAISSLERVGHGQVGHMCTGCVWSKPSVENFHTGCVASGSVEKSEAAKHQKSLNDLAYSEALKNGERVGRLGVSVVFFAQSNEFVAAEYGLKAEVNKSVVLGDPESLKLLVEYRKEAKEVIDLILVEPSMVNEELLDLIGEMPVVMLSQKHMENSTYIDAWRLLSDRNHGSVQIFADGLDKEELVEAIRSLEAINWVDSVSALGEVES